VLPLLLVLPGVGRLFDGDPEPIAPSAAAPPQQSELGWVERYPDSGPGLVFEVRSVAVTDDGWNADVALRNETDVSWELDDSATRAFGVMLFPDGDLQELQRRSRDGELPGLRGATAYRPDPPLVIEAGEQWAGTISAPGALAAGRWLRVAFGTLTALGDPPASLPEQLSWITDHAHQLEG
jgi:hypothetical protein